MVAAITFFLFFLDANSCSICRSSDTKTRRREQMCLFLLARRVSLELARTQDGTDRSELPLKAELAVKGARGVVLRANHHEGFIPARRNLLCQPTSQVYAVPEAIEIQINA